MINFLFIFLACLLSTCMFIYIYCAFTDYKFKLNFYNKLLIFIGSFIMALMKYYNFSLLSLLAYFIYYPILLYKNEKATLKECILMLLMIWIYCSVFDLLFLLFMSILSKYFYIDVFAEVYVLFSTLFVSFFIISLSKSVKLKNFTNKIVKYFHNLNYVNLLLIIFVTLIFLLGFTILTNTSELKYQILLIIILILITMLFITLFSNILIRYESKLFLKNVKDNNEFYIDLNNRNRIFKHNIINKILAIKTVSDLKASILIDDLISEINGGIDREINFKPIPYGLIGVVYQKFSENCLDINLNVNNDIKEDFFELLTPRLYNILVEKVGIVLDNAIEACAICEEKIINISIYKKENFLVLEVVNKFSTNLDLDKLGNLNYSSKGFKRGLGLFSLFRNNGVDMKINIINNLFAVKLVVRIDKRHS